MSQRSIGLALLAIVGLVAAAVYMLINPLVRTDDVARQKFEPPSTKADATAEARQIAADLIDLKTSPQPSGKPLLGLFDVARIDPDGASVFAGRAKPFETVSVLVDGERVGTVKADGNGEWVLITVDKITSKNPKLALAYGEQPPMSGRLADRQPVRTAAAAPQPPSPRDARTVRDVDALMLRELSSLVAKARDADAREPRPSGTSASATSTNPDGTSGDAQGRETASAGTADGASRSMALASAAAGSTAAPGATQTGISAAGTTLPVPIRFVFREAAFTDQGKAAATLLLEYLRLKKIDSVTLTGHADERGAYDLNMQLSAARLKTVEAFLREGGYNGELNLVPKGKTEPFDGVDRKKFPRDALFELDRRVELKVVR